MEMYFFLALILLTVNSVVSLIVYLITRKFGKEISPFTIFAFVDLILTFISGVIVLFSQISENSFGSGLALGMYLVFYLPVAAVLFFGAVIIDGISKRK